MKRCGTCCQPPALKDLLVLLLLCMLLLLFHCVPQLYNANARNNARHLDSARRAGLTQRTNLCADV